MNPYTRDYVFSMTGQQLAKALRDAGIKSENKSDRALKEELVRKGKEMEKESRDVGKGLDAAAEAMKAMAKSMATINDTLNELLAIVQESFSADQSELHAIRSAVEDIYIELDEVKGKDAQEPKKTVFERDVTEQEVETFVKTINPLFIANTKTADTYSEFESWCKARKLVPCFKSKLTNAVCREFPFKVDAGRYVAIRKQGA